MAHIVDPYNLDDDDDALFAGALHQGLIWIEDDDDDTNESNTEALASISKGKARILNGHTSRVNDVVVSGDFAISASLDKTLRVWNWKTGQHLRTLNGHTGSVNKVVVSGDFAISASLDKTLRVWNWKTGQHLRTLSGFTDGIAALAMDGDFVFVISWGTVWIWNWKTGEHVRKLAAEWHTSVPSDMAVDGDMVLSASADLLLVRNWRTGEDIHKLGVPGNYSVSELEKFALNGDFAISIDFGISIDDACVSVLNWKTGKDLDEAELRNKTEYKIDNRVFLAQSSMCLYDRKTNKWYLYSLDYGDGDDNMGVFTEDYSHILTGDDSGSVHVARVAPALLRLIAGVPIAENPSHNKHKGESAGKPTPEYKISDVLKAVQDYIRQRNEEWVNFSRVSQHLHQTFHDLKAKNLRQPNKSYKSLLQLLADHPSDFELRADSEKQGLYWIRLKPTR